ncbi:MAG: hypothetical protein ACREX3_15710 [Gammaproteobacteria bacterium]
MRRRIGCAKTAIGIDEARRPRRLGVAQNGFCLPNWTRISSKHSLRDAFVAGRYRLLLPSLWISRLAVEALNLLLAFDFELADPDEACRKRGA